MFGAEGDWNVVAGKDLILDLSTVDLSHTIADIHEIRRYNQQRFEMEQLTAIVYEDPANKICVGYKDISAVNRDPDRLVEAPPEDFDICDTWRQRDRRGAAGTRGHCGHPNHCERE